MAKFEELQKVVAQLRAPDGCPWDREQTHDSLKAACIEEAAEVICGIRILDETGNPDNLMEELGDLLLQVVMHAQIAEEEGLFTIEDVIQGIRDKMIRRHPHVFRTSVRENGFEAEKAALTAPDEIMETWDAIKKQEKAGKEWMESYLPNAFEEAKELLDAAKKRKEKGHDK